MRRRRVVLWVLAVLVALYLLPVVTGLMNPSTPVDYAMNLGSFPPRGDLRVAPPPRRLVVLEHGLWRSAGSLWKLERALRDHGYEVLNESYPSTRARIEEHAAALAERLEARLRATPGQPPELYFVGHSMGGLVIRAYLARPKARRPAACVFVATPHRGATLADLRRDGLPFRVLMGDQAALQLSPKDPLYARLGPPGVPAGNVVGGRGDAEGFHDEIPGDDDGTVAVAEAHAPWETDAFLLPYGHTRISFADETIEQVLHFLKHRRFRR